jgi:hypothetical protein
MPSADSRPTLRMNRSILSHDAVTCGGSPEVSSTAFDAQPPDLPPVCLVELGFAVLCQLAPHRRPHHPVLVHRLAPLIHASFRPRLATTPLRFSSPSPPPGWAGDFHPQAVEHVRHTKRKAPTFVGASEIESELGNLANDQTNPEGRARLTRRLIMDLVFIVICGLSIAWLLNSIRDLDARAGHGVPKTQLRWIEFQ